jgi:glycosyltransferase involved in cell wall biosynthesis
MKVVVIVPAYLTGARLLEVLAGASRAVAKENVVVVDDGSPDGYPNEAEKLGYTVLRHSQNMGKGVALRTGFEWALSHGCSGVVTMDGDGQHDPSLIPSLIDKAKSGGADIVIGSRMRDLSAMPFVRVIVNKVTSWIVSRLAGQSIEDSQSGFRFISSRVLESVRLEGTRYDLESEILIKAARKGFRIQFIPIPTVYGRETSYIRPWKDAVRFSKLVISSRKRAGDRDEHDRRD